MSTLLRTCLFSLNSLCKKCTNVFSDVLCIYMHVSLKDKRTAAASKISRLSISVCSAVFEPVGNSKSIIFHIWTKQCVSYSYYMVKNNSACMLCTQKTAK